MGIVELLLENGADINTVDKGNNSALVQVLNWFAHEQFWSFAFIVCSWNLSSDVTLIEKIIFYCLHLDNLGCE